MILTMKEFYRDIAKKKRYWIPIVFFAILTYGFAITNRTVNVDDLAFDYYQGNGKAMISSTRWGMVLWTHLISLSVFTPFVNRFLSVCLMILGAALLGCVAYYLFGEKGVWPYTIFSSVLITYPLISEIYEFDMVNMISAGNIVLGAVCILFQITFSGGVEKQRNV